MAESQPTLINSIEVGEITANLITAGTIGAAEITLGGANSIIKSSTYSPTSGGGWYIDGLGEFSLGGPSGINYDGETVVIGSNVQVTANLAADSISVGSGLNQLNINDGINGNNGGMTLGSGGNNYWYANGNFRLGGATNYVIWNGSSLSIKGAITADSGTFTGTVSGSTITGGSININSGTFSVDSLGNLTSSSANITGTVNAGSGSIAGINFSAGRLFSGPFGNWANANTGFYLDLNGYFSLKDRFYWNPDANTVVFRGSLDGASGTLSAGLVIGGSLRIGDNVRINEATADGGVTTFKVRGNNNSASGWAARFQRENGTYILEARNDLRVGIGSGGTYSLSDQRTKINIEDSDLGLNFINSLKPRVYNLVDNYNDILENGPSIEAVISTQKMYGFIAQEVKQIADQHCENYGGWDESQETTLQSISYEQLISPIVQAIKELSKKVDYIESLMI